MSWRIYASLEGSHAVAAEGVEKALFLAALARATARAGHQAAPVALTTASSIPLTISHHGTSNVAIRRPTAGGAPAGFVPLESVGLTGRSSFKDAIEQGKEYFAPKERSRFLMMLDVVTARERNVTPLPLGPRLQ